MRKPNFDMNIFTQRRAELAKQMAPNSSAIFFAHPEYVRNHDVYHAYRPDSNFFYLTGFEEPEAIFVFRPGKTPETVMFVRPKDVQRETWDGFRFGPEATAREFGMSKGALISDFEREIIELLKGASQIYHSLNIDSRLDQKLWSVLATVKSSMGRTGRGHLPVYDAAELVGTMRLRKSEYDVSEMRRACDISAEGHIAAMKMTKPGVNERQLHGVLVGSFLMQGASREGYNTIVATGANATTLHYVFNDQACKAGDLILIDAGAEYNYYTGDITRTYPVSGKFSDTQKLVYQKVLDIQKSLIQMVKPGITFKTFQDTTVDALTDVMLELKLLSGSRSQLVESLAYKKYYPHGVGHWLGMDVHDSGKYSDGAGGSITIEPGFAFTIEPGLYIPFDDMSAPEKLRGIGIRIEDNIVVTKSGHENLTAKAPKEIEDIEAIVGQGASLTL
jgi:Xaa-Pro aminopeptidase